MSNSTASNGSKKFHVTLSWEEGAQIEEAAAIRGVSAAQIIRERLGQWQAKASHLPQTSNTEPQVVDLLPLTVQIQQVSEQLEEMQDALQQMGDRPAPQPDPQMRSALQPVHTRMQSLETQVGIINQFLQQMLREGTKRQSRLELWLEAIYTMVPVLLLDDHPEEELVERQTWINEIQERLDHHFKENQ